MTASDAFIRSLMVDVEGLAEGIAAEDAALRSQEEEELHTAAEEQSGFLQTKTYSLSEVGAELAEWKAIAWRVSLAH